jgi:hypothetical protein
MQRIIQSIGKNPIRVLFLCSYDKDTLEVVENVIDNILDIYDPQFQKKLIAVLAKNVKIIEARSQEEEYLILAEKYKNVWDISIFKNGEIIGNFRCGLKEYKSIIRRLESSLKDMGQYREITAITKVIGLCKWADIIIVIKHLELGKGGELIELAIIACSYFFKGDTSIVQKTIY